MPDQEQPDGNGYFVIPKEENSARTSTFFDLNSIEDELEEMVGNLSLVSAQDPEDLYSLSWYIEGFQKTVREEVRDADRHSLNELALSAMSIADDLHRVRRSIDTERMERERVREQETKNTKQIKPKAVARWIGEKKSTGKLPLPD